MTTEIFINLEEGRKQTSHIKAKDLARRGKWKDAWKVAQEPDDMGTLNPDVTEKQWRTWLENILKNESSMSRADKINLRFNERESQLDDPISEATARSQIDRVIEDILYKFERMEDGKNMDPKLLTTKVINELKFKRNAKKKRSVQQVYQEKIDQLEADLKAGKYLEIK